MSAIKKMPELKLDANNNSIGTNIKNTTPAIIVGSLVFVTGLIWNDTIRAIIDHYAPEKYKNSKNIIYKLIYAFTVTIIIIIIISIIMKYAA